MLHSFSSRPTIRLWEIDACPLDFPPLISSLGTDVVISCWSDRPKMWATATLQQYIGFYTRLTCVHVEPAQPVPSTAPPLPCETHPAQRSSITVPLSILRSVTQGTKVSGAGSTRVKCPQNRVGYYTLPNLRLQIVLG